MKYILAIATLPLFALYVALFGFPKGDDEHYASLKES